METDIQQVKDTSILLLRSDIKLCDELPPEIHVYHPFISSSFQKLGDGFADIIKDKAAYREFIEIMTNIIQESTLECIFAMVNGPYKMTWYKYVSPYLGDKDRAKYLTESWTMEENPNMDPNCTLRYVISEFKKCKKKYLMCAKDLAVYNALPDEFTIYRGVSVGRNPKGISYTRNLDKAEWFAHRFDEKGEKGYILAAQGHKDKVLAYLNTRNEDELVYNTIGLKTHRLEED